MVGWAGPVADAGMEASVAPAASRQKAVKALSGRTIRLMAYPPGNGVGWERGRMRGGTDRTEARVKPPVLLANAR